MTAAWSTGHDIIAGLIDEGHLEQLGGEAANGDYLLDQARRRLAGAHAARSVDDVSAFELAYDAVRQAATATLVQQGLRPHIDGGHIAVVQAVQAQFGRNFAYFGAMRRLRNQLEYPRDRADLIIPPKDLEKALTFAQDTIDAVTTLLPQLGMWRR